MSLKSYSVRYVTLAACCVRSKFPQVQVRLGVCFALLDVGADYPSARRLCRRGFAAPLPGRTDVRDGFDGRGLPGPAGVRPLRNAAASALIALAPARAETVPHRRHARPALGLPVGRSILRTRWML